jgi:lincosamide nucleotidyltransferase A/C/D/E
MTAAQVVALCRRLERLGLTIWLDGGWGVDALLGRQTRPHDDLDIVVEDKDLHRLRTLLEAEGFRDVPRDDTQPWNFVLGHPDGRLIDFHVVVFDAGGNGISGPGVFPAASFGATGTIDGHTVECLTVEHQLARSGYALRDKDFADLGALRERFSS